MLMIVVVNSLFVEDGKFDIFLDWMVVREDVIVVRRIWRMW